MASRDIIVVGASAGGFEAIQKLVVGFPADLPAAVFVTVHVTARSDAILAHQIDRSGLLRAASAVDGESIESGRIYVAPPDYHLLIEAGHLQLSHGPRENLQRPCINTMFRSAANAYGERVAGVLLTGLLDDGAAGLWEIQQHGGATIVQEPEEATFRDMPNSAIRGLNVQYIVRLAEMAPLLTRLSMSDNSQTPSKSPAAPLTEVANQACPECGGAMTAVKMGGLREYRCHIGHRIGLQTMIAQKSTVVEHALGVALSQSEELSDLLERFYQSSSAEDRHALDREIARRKNEQEALRGLTSSTRQLK